MLQTNKIDWNMLADEVQLMLSQAALRQAAETIASQAELLAEEIVTGALADRGGADALRLLASVIRVTAADELGCMGTA